MKALLICPAIRPAVPQLSEEGPLATTPILGECLVGYWIEHLAALGALRVQVVVADRAESVRTALGDGARWGVQIEVTAVGAEPTAQEAAARFRPADDPDWLAAPNDIVLMNHLPGCPEQPLFESYAGWFGALLAWIPRALTLGRVRVSEVRPGIWVGRRAHVAPTAELIAPCWIGDQVFVEPGAIIGPGAVLEDRSVIAKDARVTLSWVGPDTFVGPMTAIASSLAWGSGLTNWRSESSLRVPDSFLLCSLAPAPAMADGGPSARAARTVGAPARGAAVPRNWIGEWPESTRHAPNSNPST